MRPRKVADIVEQATVQLARALDQPAERHLASLIRYRDPSVQSQERRHFGDVSAVRPPRP
jgi:predicted negative regulator of RcsB-dependent stress response